MNTSFGISKYRSVKLILDKIEPGQRESLTKVRDRIGENLVRAESRSRKADLGSRSIVEAARSTTRLAELDTLEEFDKKDRLISHAMGGDSNFIHIYANISQGLKLAWKTISSIASGMDADEITPSLDGAETARERMHDLSVEYQLNKHSCETFLNACIILIDLRHQLINMIDQIATIFDAYCNALTKRHTSEGIKISHSPILTDFAMVIYNNISHHGDIGNGFKDAEISAYSLRKAESIINWVKDEDCKDILLSDTLGFTSRIKQELIKIWDTAVCLENIFEKELKAIAQVSYRQYIPAKKEDFDQRLLALENVDPNNITYHDRSSSMTEEDRKNLQFKNEAIDKICLMLRGNTPSNNISKTVWEDVKKLNRHYLEVNSFYVCRIAQGNPFSGKSSGQLEVIPGKKPTASFDDIIGSGFDSVREFVKHISNLRKWAPLYLITSPRKSVDKSNILLIGPMGCGKTECMRAICNEEDCIAIFAAGSDFLTAWMGEAQKNPKRLFEEAVRLQKISGRHVHILIDEIDEILNNDRSTTNINLSLEFQMIMDGIVEYPNISVWGATNNPERIPMPMIRRFSEVLIVGKLNQEQRVQLFKHFLSSMPLSVEFTDDRWESFANRLEGATGDVIRKICEFAWRKSISKFIEDNPEDAERMLKIIGMLSYDSDSGFKPSQLDSRKADQEIDETNLGGEKTSRRKKFLKEFGRVFEIQPSLIDESIDESLKNVGILNEIDTAIRTYTDAEKMIAVMNDERKKVISHD